VQQLQPWQITALLTAQELNRDVQVDAEGHPYINHGKDTPRYISNGMRKQRLYWGLTGCLPGVQHFKLCEPRAVAIEASLRCKQCAV
jgi:hypothetical protein